MQVLAWIKYKSTLVEVGEASEEPTQHTGKGETVLRHSRLTDGYCGVQVLKEETRRARQ